MADPKISTDFTLRQEDSTLSGTITNISGDSGGLTRFGLCAKYHPTLVAAGFYDASMDAATALPLAEQTYLQDYATPLLIAEIDDQAIATALLSFAVNEEGTGDKGTAVKLLQESCGAVPDGVIGPATIASINELDPPYLLSRYCEAQEAHYRGIVAANPSQAEFLNGWLNRVEAVKALGG